mmetsp:Transcript_3176/g.8949  ORF Transcript_3176/g.8949 Transcript_3176/m.8949 type:complete len:211 (+) Transcript_3176:477-1109(+)
MMTAKWTMETFRGTVKWASPMPCRTLWVVPRTTNLSTIPMVEQPAMAINTMVWWTLWMTPICFWKMRAACFCTTPNNTTTMPMATNILPSTMISFGTITPIRDGAIMVRMVKTFPPSRTPWTCSSTANPAPLCSFLTNAPIPMENWINIWIKSSVEHERSLWRKLKGVGVSRTDHGKAFWQPASFVWSCRGSWMANSCPATGRRNPRTLA